MTKYKPCCDRRCCVAGCKSNAEGACYCCCRLLDAIKSQQSIQTGQTIAFGAGNIYYPDMKRINEFYRKLSPADKAEVDENKAKAGERILQLEQILKEKYLNE